MVRVEIMKNGENQKRFEDYNQQTHDGGLYLGRRREDNFKDYFWISVQLNAIFFFNLRITGSEAGLGFIYK